MLAIEGLRKQRATNGRLERGLIRTTAAILAVPEGTLRDWVLRDPKLGPGVRQSLRLDEDDIHAWVRGGRVTTTLHQHLCTKYGQVSLRTAQRAIAAIPKEIRAYAEFGDYEQLYRCGVFSDRVGAEHIRQILFMDHTYLRVPVRWPGPPSFLAPAWLTSGLDDFSRAIPGWEVSPAREIRDGEERKDAPDATVVAMALAYIMAPHSLRLNPFEGVWDEILTDNAAEFRSNQMLTALVDFGVTKMKMRPYRPHERGRKERSYSTLKGQLMPRLFGSDRGPTNWDGSIKGFDPKRAIDYEELVEELERWFNEYHNTPHSALGGLTPIEAWERDVSERAA